MMEPNLASAEATFDRLAELLMSPTLEEIREHLRCLRNIAKKDGVIGRRATAPPVANVFRCEGDYWMVAYQGRTSRLHGSLGFQYIAHLLAHPGREIAALEIASSSARSEILPCRAAEPAPLLDARAIGEYRARLSSLAEELEEARASNDLGRCDRLEWELETVRGELDSAFGLGGRSRQFPSEAERARLNVTRAIRSAMARIASADPVLGEHLSRLIHTGAFCCYDPDPAALPRWEFE